jgi:aldehyde dehydrogenase (NAD+)
VKGIIAPGIIRSIGCFVLVSAVAAGNQVVLKPSELTGNTSNNNKTFHTNHVEVVQGGVDVSQNLLAQRWDYIFYRSVVGKIVAQAAAKHLTLSH